MARVLIVEPDRQIRKFIAGILADFGHHVEQCDGAREARRWLDRARFDVLATDLVLAEDSVDDFLGLAHGLPLLTLRGRRFRPGAASDERPARLHSMPFRFGDLAALVAAIGALQPAILPVVQNGRRTRPLAGRADEMGRPAASAA